MHKHLFILTLPTIIGMATLLPSAAIYAAEPQSAIGYLEERLQQTQNMQNELTRQLQEFRRMQDELTEQRRQVEERGKQLSAQVQALQQQSEAQGKQFSAQVHALQQQTEEQGKQFSAQMQALQQRVDDLAAHIAELRKQDESNYFNSQTIVGGGFAGICAGGNPPYYFELEVYNTNGDKYLKVNGYRKLLPPGVDPGNYGLVIISKQENILQLGNHNSWGTVVVDNVDANEKLTGICKIFNLR